MMMMISAADTTRLTTTAERVRTLTAEVRAERARRNSIVAKLIDDGNKYRAVARASGLSVAAVAGIMARHEPEE